MGMVCAPIRSIIPSQSSRIIDRTGAQTMLYLTCTMISSVDLALYGVSRGKRLGIYGLWYKGVCNYGSGYEYDSP